MEEASRIQMVMVVYDEGMEEDVQEVLEQLEAMGYTKLLGAQGRGRSGPRMGDPIWPGLNNILCVALPASEVPDFLQRIRQLRSRFRRPPALKFFVWDVVEED